MQDWGERGAEAAKPPSHGRSAAIGGGCGREARKLSAYTSFESLRMAQVANTQ